MNGERKKIIPDINSITGKIDTQMAI